MLTLIKYYAVFSSGVAIGVMTLCLLQANRDHG